MAHINRKQILFFAFVVYLLATSFSVYCLVIKGEALQFDTKDYNYFIEQAARLTDPQLSKRFTLNIEGYNMLGLQGTEGVKNLFHAIHNEYFRYSYALFYWIFHNTLPIYIFYSLIYFCPLLYFALVATAKGEVDWKPVALFTALYVLFPVTFNAVTDDLRPRMLYAAAWCLAVLAVYYERPFPEKLITFCLLPFIREEGILLGAVVIALNFVRMQGKPGRWFQTLVLLALDAFALVAFLVFMNWGGYTRVDVNFDPRSAIADLFTTHLPLLLGLLVLLAALLGYVWFKKRSQFNNLMLVLVYCAGIAITGFQTVRMIVSWFPASGAGGSFTAWEVYRAVVGFPLTGLLFYILILFLVLLWDGTQGKVRKLFAGFLVLLCIVSAGTSLSYFPAQVAGWLQIIPEARLVWDFTRSHDRYQTNVLLDYDTYQAFYNYENILVYNRLPLWRVPPEKRFYPENQEILARQIKKRMEFAVIARTSLSDVEELARLAGVSVEEMASNQKYMVLKFGANP